MMFKNNNIKFINLIFLLLCLLAFQNCKNGAYSLNSADLNRNSEMHSKENFSSWSSFLASTSASSSTGHFDLGIAQSDLVWHENSTIYKPESMILDLKQVGVKWLRTNFRSKSNATYFANLISAANKNGMQVVATILQEPEDYIQPVYGPSNTVCGWSGGALKFSKIDVNLYKNRLRFYLDALQASGASIAAFEIGNELDWNCFNGDIYVGANSQSSSDESIKNFLYKYAQILKESSLLIKSYPSFSSSRILTFGAANCFLFSGVSCLKDPYQFLQSLKSISGADYLTKYSDGIALHLYPTRIDSFDNEMQTVFKYQNLLGKDKPIWITETGFAFHDQSRNHIGWFNSFFENLKNIPAIKNIFIYTYYSYAAADDAVYSLSLGPGRPLDTAASMFRGLTPINPSEDQNGKCDTSKQWGCSVGSVGSSNGLTDCGTTLIWTCKGATARSATVNCSRINDSCAHGKCDQSEQWGCAVGTVSSSNGQTVCGSLLTWTCKGSNAGAATVSCSRINDSCN